jgi:hypothetical protein
MASRRQRTGQISPAIATSLASAASVRTISIAPPIITARSATLSSTRGKNSAAAIDPAPKANNVQASADASSPSVPRTNTTELTSTIAPAAAAAMFSASSPRRRGVAR